MIRRYAKRIGALGVIFCLVSSGLYSQIDNVDFLKAGAADGAALTSAYILPWANAFGAGINGNWYNTAKPHKLGGFDISIGASVGIVPSSDNSFDVSTIGLKTFTGTGISPTISVQWRNFYWQKLSCCSTLRCPKRIFLPLGFTTYKEIFN